METPIYVSHVGIGDAHPSRATARGGVANTMPYVLLCYASSNLESIYAQFYMGGPGLIMAPLGAQEQSIQEIINQQLLLQEQLRPLADGGLMTVDGDFVTLLTPKKQWPGW